MNVLKNFEALFVITLGLACAATYAVGDTAETQSAAVASYTVPAAASDMQVVVVSAKRLSAEQKKQSLLDESKATLAAGNATASKI
jgi:hypothetical protein